MSNHSSTFTALRNPTYCRIWVASLLSSTCISAHDTAATWVMNMLSPSALLLSLMSTVASLPFFLFTLPAGALAERDGRLRRKRVRTAEQFKHQYLLAQPGLDDELRAAANTLEQTKGMPFTPVA